MSIVEMCKIITAPNSQYNVPKNNQQVKVKYPPRSATTLPVKMPTLHTVVKILHVSRTIKYRTHAVAWRR